MRWYRSVFLGRFFLWRGCALAPGWRWGRATGETDPDGWVDVMPAADCLVDDVLAGSADGTLGRKQWHVDAAEKVLVCDGDGGHDMLLWDKVQGDAIFPSSFGTRKWRV